MRLPACRPRHVLQHLSVLWRLGCQQPQVDFVLTLLAMCREPYHYVRFDDWDDDNYLLIVGERHCLSDWLVVSAHILASQSGFDTFEAAVHVAMAA